ncbi:MAG: helix-turn-helix domain-containing protein [Mycobacterium sp.]|nr:helix-turn-helix domain-containing protein [Mycobacterium sp.]
MMPEKLLTTRDVAARFGVHPAQIRRRVTKGILTPTLTTPGDHHRFAETDIDQFQCRQKGVQ